MAFNTYPYTDMHEMNLDWVIKTLKDVLSKLDTFISLNSLTFSDPLEWDITKQYVKNVIVIDENGNAYLSKEAVPVGVDIDNTDYWLEIFNFTEYVTKSNKNLTVNFEYNTDKATADYSVDDWLVWNEVLYKVTAAIAEGDDLVIDTNIEHFTVEDFLKDFITTVNQTILQYKNDIDASEAAYRLQLAGDIASTTASLQAQLDAAIAGVTVDSEVINARIGADGVTYTTLGEAIRTQFDNVDHKLTYISEETGNIVDWIKLAESPIVYTNGFLEGQANQFTALYGQGTGGLASNLTGQYTIMMSGVRVSGSGTTGYGLGIRVAYTDSTYTTEYLMNQDTEVKSFKILTDPNKNISEIFMRASVGTTNIWDVKDIMIAPGDIEKYLPPLSAVDSIMRNNFYDIVNTNTLFAEVNDSVIQAKRGYLDWSDHNIDPVLQIAVFTDIHGDGVNLNKYLEFCSNMSSYITDKLCLGDVVSSRYENSITFWNNASGIDDVLLAIGNHDTWLEGTTPPVKATQTDVYNKFFSSHVSDWNVTQPSGAAASGLMYYYKDYADVSVRLIVLDCMYWDSTEKTWFDTILADARTNNLAVMVAVHYNPTEDLEIIPGINFYSLDYDFEDLETFSADPVNSVDSFIQAGGVFIAWLSGHSHFDCCGVYEGPHGNQLSLAFENASCNSYWNDSDRVRNTLSEQSFNCISIDTSSKLIKVVRVGNNKDRYLRSKKYFTYKYDTGELITAE